MKKYILLLVSTLLFITAGAQESDVVTITVNPGTDIEVVEAEAATAADDYQANDYGAKFSQSIADEFMDDDANDSPLDFLGVPFFNRTRFIQLLVRFLFNLLICWIIVHFFYYRKSKRRDYYITLILFNTTMFLLICMMQNMDMQIGLTLGLFAIFGMIRYRTETVPVREMTYLFVITGMAVINGFAMAVSYSELVLANVLFIVVIALFENVRLRHSKATKLILYERIELITPEHKAEMIADLEKRTGLKIDDAEVGHIDFLRDVAFVKITYELAKGETGSINHVTKAKDYIS